MFPNRVQSREFLRPNFQPPLPQLMPITSNQSVYQDFFGAPIKQSISSQNNFSPTTSSTREPRPPPINQLMQSPPPVMSISSQNNCPSRTPSIQDYYPAAHINDQTTTNIDDYYENYDDYYESYEQEDQREYRRKRGEKLARKTRTYFCETCSIECVGEQAYQSHLDGKNHKKKANNAQGTSTACQSGPKNKPAYYCNICNVDCTGADSYATHINGQKHQKAIKLLIRVNKPIPMTEISVVLPDGTAAATGGEGQSQQNKSRKRTLPQSLGDQINPNKIPLLNCNAPEIINDNYIAEKIGQIELSDREKATLEKFVLLVERTLFDVSNQIEGNRQNAQPKPNLPANSAPPRLLCGIMRVGLLANQLLLKMDRRADLVILCSDVPTLGLLRQIVELFRRNINGTWFNQNAPQEYSIVEVFNESAFCVTRAGIRISVFIILTCSAMRQWSPGDINYHPYQEPPNALPKIPCLHALAEMRWTKFYQVKCQPLASMNWIVKIVREFGKRVPTWNPLSNWIIILIVEKAISMYSAGNVLSPSAALKSLFNAISDGHIFGSLQNEFVAQLPDPCEKQFTDSIASLTMQERKNLWASANYSQREMNKNNLAQLLALEGTGIPSKNHHVGNMRKKKGPNNARIGGVQKDGPAAEQNIFSRSEQLEPKHGKTKWDGKPTN